MATTDDDLTDDVSDGTMYGTTDETVTDHGVANVADPTIDGATRDLFRRAVAVRERSHSPYSGYPVGAAIRTTAGEVFVGCNVENASYPEGTCAEAGAIAAMVAGSSAAGPAIETIVTVTDGDTPGTPCGGCRQRIREFAVPGVVIHACTVAGGRRTMSMDELLPWSFGPERLFHEDEASHDPES